MKQNLKKMSMAEQVAYIDQSLGYKSLVRPPQYWLKTPYPRLNAVMGSKEYGLAYGKLYTIAGEPSSGKSAIVAYLLGLAQADGAKPGWVDGENSYDPKHVRRQGLHSGKPVYNAKGKFIGYEKVALFWPLYGTFGYKSKNKKRKAIKLEDVEAAEDLFDRVEIWLKLQRKIDPNGKIALAVDSTTSFCPEEELVAGMSEQNMRTRTSPAVFLNTLTKRWVNLALNTNAMIFLIAQLRDNPGIMFGNPKRITGGNGIIYYPSSVVWMRRVAGGEVTVNKKQIGTKGLISNKKNKVGAGSIERKKCAYECLFYEKNWKFMSADKLKKKGK